MKTLTSLKCAAVLLPALAVGMPMAYAGDEKRDDPQDSAKTSSSFGADRQDQRKVTSHNEFFATMPARGYQSDSLIGQEVKSRSNDESIGEISNLLLDENDQVVAAIISVGGSLGIGERDVAIAWDQIERRVDGDETTLWVNQTEQSLKDAPEFSSETNSSDSTYSRREQRAEKRQDSGRPGMPPTASAQANANKSDANKSDTKKSTAYKSDKNKSDKNKSTAYKSDANNSDANDTTHSQFLTTIPTRGYHSDSLIGHEVVNRSNDESVGEVSDLVLDENGQVVAVIVSVGGVMGLGERDVAISWDQIERTVDGDEITLSVDLTEESLNDAPKYSSENKQYRQ